MRTNKAMLSLLPILLKKLSNGASLSTSNLSEIYKIPRRTIHDNISKHLKQIYPDNIFFNKSTNMWCSNKNILAETLLSAEEIITMNILEEHSKSLGNEFNTFTKILFNRFKKRTSYEIYKRTNFEKISKNDDKTFALVKNAIKSKTTIKCIYKNKTRSLNPIKIIMLDGYWYALVIDNKDNTLKTFYLKGLINIEFDDKTFESITPNIQNKLEGAINSYFKDKEHIFVELEIHKEISKYFHRKPLSKKQYLRPSQNSDYEVMSIYVTDLMEIIPTIQQFIPFIKVISPIELDNRININLKNYYEENLSEYIEAI